MDRALRDVREHSMSVHVASKKYNIPDQTLRDRIHGKVKDEAKVGRPTFLSPEEENEVVQTCVVFANMGHGMDKNKVLQVLQGYLRCHKRKMPGKGDKLGYDWWRGFMERHKKELSVRKPQQLQMIRAKAGSPEVLHHWFNVVLGPTLRELGLLNKPECIYNADETFVCLSGGSSTIICKKGMKAPQQVIGGSGRENVTVHMCCNGAGVLLPPYVIYTSKRSIPLSYTQGGPIGARYGNSENGWMNEISFLDWMKSIFITSLTHRPVVLILDGHTSHVSYELRILAQENNIHLLKLPSHTTHLLQPLDVAVIKPFKTAWNREVLQHVNTEQKAVTKADFACLLKRSWDNGLKPEYAVNGFRKTGIFPFNPSAIGCEATAPSSLYQQVTGEELDPNIGDDALGQMDDVHVPLDEIMSNTQMLDVPLDVSPQQAISQTPPPLGATLDPQCLISPMEVPLQQHQPTCARVSFEEVSPQVTPHTSAQLPMEEASQQVTPCTSSNLPTPQQVTPSPLASSQPTAVISTPSSDLHDSLRSFFLSHLTSTRTKSTATSARKRVPCNLGESLTAESAIKKVEEKEKEKEMKEKQKEERKKMREEKKRLREQSKASKAACNKKSKETS